MIREHLVATGIAGEKDFRWRGDEITRLEGFSDAVFAFAVALLVVALEVPKTFHELMNAMRGFAAFGACFALLAEVWSKHYRFFRRYGLQNPWVVFLNCVLLFFVLFYVYPLKFLFYGLFGGGPMVITAAEARILFVIYGAGYAAVSLVFALLYRHAWKHRIVLALDEIEQLRTRQSLVDHLALALIGLASIGLALSLPSKWVGIAGWFYSVIGLYFTWVGAIFGKRERLLRESMRANAPAGED